MAGSDTGRVSNKSKRKGAARARGARRSQPGRKKPGRKKPNRRRLGFTAGAIVALLILAALVVVNQLPSNSPTLLAGTGGQAQGQAVDGTTAHAAEKGASHTPP